MPRRTLLWFCLLGLGAVVAWPVRAGNWPRFRGPNGTGVAQDKGLPVTWHDQDGLLWKVALPGQGNSSPVVWGRRLFVQTASADGKERQLLCLDTRTGKTLWSHAATGRGARTHPKNTLASATPATDGQRVYAAFWDGTDIELVACTVEGRRVWERNLGPFHSQHGPGASPVVYGDRVVLANDQDKKATLVVLDAKDGSIAWQVPRPAYRACYSAPLLRQQPGLAPELIVVSTMEVTGYDLKTGQKNWAWNWSFKGPMPLRTTSSPVLSQDTLLACSGDGGGDRHAVALRLDGAGAGTQARLLWENRKDFPYVPTPVVSAKHVYFVNDLGVAGCYALATGKQVWHERLPGAGTVLSSPILVDGRLYAATESGQVFVLAAEPTFRLLARNSLGEPVRATPAVADGRLFIRGEQHLFCIGKGK